MIFPTPPAPVSQLPAPSGGASVPTPDTPAPVAEALQDPVPETLALAESLLRHAIAGQTLAERRHGAGMARLVEDALGKQFTVRLADEVFRSHRATAEAERLRHL